jgi:hypothetical protein
MSYVSSVIGRFGGSVALGICSLFWLAAWFSHRTLAPPFAALFAALWWPYVALWVVGPAISIVAARNTRAGRQTYRSALLQVVLALSAAAVSLLSISLRYIELP